MLREEVLPDPASVARRAAAIVAEEARAAVQERGRFLWAVSGGNTPWHLLRELSREDVRWERVVLFQVDERVAPAGDPERNLTQLRTALLSQLAASPAVHPMPVEEPDLVAAAAAYAATLREVAGSPPVLDLVHLGLGDDGHTASLVPGDPVLEVDDAEVAVSETYRGKRRMTLTFPALNRARAVLWVVAGAGKGLALARLRRGDGGIPAGRIERARARVLCDADADRASRVSGGFQVPG